MNDAGSPLQQHLLPMLLPASLLLPLPLMAALLTLLFGSPSLRSTLLGMMAAITVGCMLPHGGR